MYALLFVFFCYSLSSFFYFLFFFWLPLYGEIKICISVNCLRTGVGAKGDVLSQRRSILQGPRLRHQTTAEEGWTLPGLRAAARRSKPPLSAFCFMRPSRAAPRRPHYISSVWLSLVNPVHLSIWVYMWRSQLLFAVIDRFVENRNLCLPHLHSTPRRYVYSFQQNVRTWLTNGQTDQTDRQTPHDAIGRIARQKYEHFEILTWTWHALFHITRIPTHTGTSSLIGTSNCVRAVA